MNRAEVLAILRPWHERTVELHRQWGAFAALTGAADDSPLADAIWRVHKAYTQAIAAQVAHLAYLDAKRRLHAGCTI